MGEVRVMAPTGVIGSGFLESSFARGLSLEPHVIACDGGSTDPGPAFLGIGESHFSREGTKRDLKIMLRGRDKAKVPLIVGSCGTGGGDAGVDWMRDIALEIAHEEGLHFRLALVRSEQDRDYLKGRFREGRIQALNPAPALSEEVIDRSAHIVGMMGHEPIEAAVGEGAEVVLCGRSSDTSLFAAVPLSLGAPAGPTWHAAKILECGVACAVQRKRPDSIFAWIHDDHFDIEPLALDVRCSPQSVASHTLYENADPFLLVEPAGVIDTLHSQYEALDDRSVRVRNSEFRESDRYSIKLEGAERVGYQYAIIAGVRDPIILRQLDSWLAGMKAGFEKRVVEIFDGRVGQDDYRIDVRVYGRDAVMGALEPEAGSIGHEVGLLFTVTSETRDVSAAIAKTFSHFGLHYPIPEWRGLISGLAFPFTPAELDRGDVYRFSLNHVVFPDNPYEMFRTEIVEV